MPLEPWVDLAHGILLGLGWLLNGDPIRSNRIRHRHAYDIWVRNRDRILWIHERRCGTQLRRVEHGIEGIRVGSKELTRVSEQNDIRIGHVSAEAFEVVLAPWNGDNPERQAFESIRG